jgi:hypothetical protein
VEVVDSDYTEASESNATYGWDNSVWYNSLNTLLAKYEGKSVSDLLSVYVTCDAETVAKENNPYDFETVKGQPSELTDDTYVTSGSTQGSGRLMLAVQNALEKLDGYVVTEGDYNYENPWGGANYGIKTKVVLKDDVIQKVTIIPSSYTEASESNATYGWDNSVWYNGLNKLLSAYEGKTVSEIYAVKVTADKETVAKADNPYDFDSVKGQPSDISDNTFITTGSTQGSGRLMLSVQNALYKVYGTPTSAATQYTDKVDKDSSTYTVEDGVVSYKIVTAKNSPAGSFTIKVTVGTDNKITSYEVVTNGSTADTYADAMYATTNYVGKTLAELEALSSSDTIKTGATRSNELALNAALFALANYSVFVG